MINCDHRGADDYFGEPSVPTLSSKNLQHLNLIRKKKKSSAIRSDGQACGDTTVHDKDFNDTDDDDYSTVVPSEDESIDAVDHVRTKVAHVTADKYTAEEIEGEGREETKINSKHNTTLPSSSSDVCAIANSNKDFTANYSNENTDCIIQRKSDDDVITAKKVEEEYLFDEKIIKFENNPAITKGMKVNKESELNKVKNLASIPVCGNDHDQTEKFNSMNLTRNKNSMMLNGFKNDVNCKDEKLINDFNSEMNETNKTKNDNIKSVEDILIHSRISPIHFNHQTENENENSENNENDGNNENSIPSHEKNKILKKVIISPGKLFVDTFHEYVDEECSGRRSNESAERSAQHSPSKSKTVTGLQNNNNSNNSSNSCYKQSMSPLSPRQNGIKSFNLSPLNIQKKTSQDCRDEKIKNDIFTEKFKLFLDVCRIESESKESKKIKLEDVNDINSGFDKKSILNYLNNNISSSSVLSKTVESDALNHENENTEILHDNCMPSSLDLNDYLNGKNISLLLERRAKNKIISNDKNKMGNNDDIINMKKDILNNKNIHENKIDNNQSNYIKEEEEEVEVEEMDNFDEFNQGKELGSESTGTFSKESSAKSENQKEKEEILRISSRSLASYFFPALNDDDEKIVDGEYEERIISDVVVKSNYIDKKKKEEFHIQNNKIQYLDKNLNDKKINVNSYFNTCTISTSICNKDDNKSNTDNKQDDMTASPRHQVIHDYVEEQKKYGNMVQNGKSQIMYGSSDCTTDGSVNLSGVNDCIDFLNDDNGDYNQNNDSLYSIKADQSNNNNDDNYDNDNGNNDNNNNNNNNIDNNKNDDYMNENNSNYGEYDFNYGAESNDYSSNSNNDDSINLNISNDNNIEKFINLNKNEIECHSNDEKEDNKNRLIIEKMEEYEKFQNRNTHTIIENNKYNKNIYTDNNNNKNESVIINEENSKDFKNENGNGNGNEDEDEEEYEYDIDEYLNNENNVTDSTYCYDYFDYSVYEEYHRYTDSTATITDTHENDGYYYQNERSQKNFSTGNEIDFNFLDEKKKKKLSSIYLTDQDMSDSSSTSTSTSTSSSSFCTNSTSSSLCSSPSNSKLNSISTSSSTSSSSSSTLSKSIQNEYSNEHQNNNEIGHEKHLPHDGELPNDNSQNNHTAPRRKITVQNVDFYATEKHGIYKRDITEIDVDGINELQLVKSNLNEKLDRCKDLNGGDNYSNNNNNNNDNNDNNNISDNNNNNNNDNNNSHNNNDNNKSNYNSNDGDIDNNINSSLDSRNYSTKIDDNLTNVVDNGCHNKNTNIKNDPNNNQALTPKFIDFQIILTEDDFAVLEKRKQASNRVLRFNKSVKKIPSSSRSIKKS